MYEYMNLHAHLCELILTLMDTYEYTYINQNYVTV
jgi:hypothetical protein